MLRMKRAQRPLLESRMQFDLVDGRCYAAHPDDGLKLVLIKVRYADRLREALSLELNKRGPTLHIKALLRRRPMDKVKIDRFAAKPLGALLKGVHGAVVALLTRQEFRRQKNRRTRLANSLSHPHFIVIGA